MYYFQEYLIQYVFRHNKVNRNSLRDNQQSTSLEEHVMRKKHPICGKSLEEGKKNHEVEHQLRQVYFRKENKQEGEENNTIPTNRSFSNQRESTDGSLNYEEYLLMRAHNSMVVTQRSYLKILLQDKVIMIMKMKTLWQIMKNQDQLSNCLLSLKELTKSRRNKKRRFTFMNHPSLKALPR